MQNTFNRISQALILALLLAGLNLSVAKAEDDNEDGGLPAVVNAKWKGECSSCHIAYPPHLLPAKSWRMLMSGLDRHFGSDASIDLADAQEITVFLEKNANQRKQQNLDKYIEEIRLSPGITCNPDFMLGRADHMKSYLLAAVIFFSVKLNYFFYVIYLEKKVINITIRN